MTIEGTVLEPWHEGQADVYVTRRVYGYSYDRAAEFGNAWWRFFTGEAERDADALVAALEAQGGIVRRYGDPRRIP
jgi:hypothetical protein